MPKIMIRHGVTEDYESRSMQNVSCCYGLRSPCCQLSFWTLMFQVPWFLDADPNGLVVRMFVELAGFTVTRGRGWDASTNVTSQQLRKACQLIIETELVTTREN